MTTRYIAIWDDRLRQYKWHPRKTTDRPLELLPPLPPGCIETVYVGTGYFVSREDGERAEILTESKGNAK